MWRGRSGRRRSRGFNAGDCEAGGVTSPMSGVERRGGWMVNYRTLVASYRELQSGRRDWHRRPSLRGPTTSKGLLVLDTIGLPTGRAGRLVYHVSEFLYSVPLGTDSVE